MWTRIWCSGKFFSQGRPFWKTKPQQQPSQFLLGGQNIAGSSLISRTFFPEVALRLHFCVNIKKKTRQNLPPLGKENFASSSFSWRPETLGAIYSAVTPCCIEGPITHGNHKGGDRKFGMKCAGFTREWLPAVHPELLHRQEFLW